MLAWKATEQKLFIDMEPFDTRIGQTRVYLDRDEGIRPDTSLEKLSQLKPVFTPEGPHTAGTSSQISDGAAVLLLTTYDKAREYGFKPIAKVVGYSWVAVETWRFTEAPMYVIDKLLKKLSWSVNDVDVFEVNEAFAPQVLAIQKELNIPFEKLNIHGGAIAEERDLEMWAGE